MSESLVEARSVDKIYGTGPSATTAVTDATCRVVRGDSIALVGPSGSGKTTLLSLLAGLEKPTSGTVTWPALGRIERVGPQAGYVFQNPSLLPPLTAAENVSLPLLLANVPARRAHDEALKLLERFDLAGIADRLPDDMSGGQSARVAVARAVIGGPLIVFADEPTGQLDGSTAVAVMERLIAEVNVSGAALVVATHDARIARLLRARWTIHHGILDAAP